MKIYFSKSAIMKHLMFTNPDYKHQRKSIIVYRIVLVVLALLVFGLFLRKIYEVPVHYTEYQVLQEGSFINADLHFFLIRDFDRHKESSNKILVNDSTWNGGVFVEGVFWDKDSTGTVHSTWFNNDSLLNRKLESILDTAHFDHENNMGDIVYAMIKTTRQQRLCFLHKEREISAECHGTWQMKTEYYHSGVYNTPGIENKYITRNKWSIPVDTLFIHKREQNNKNGICREYFIFSSKGEKAIPVFTSIRGDIFEKPNPFLVAEDVSKLVDIIRFPLATGQYVKSITIDYKCPTEFGYLNPEPDERTFSSIRYYDKNKINKIAWDGLTVHATFPDMENIQEVRLFLLTTVITILITLLVSLFYKLSSRKMYKWWKKHSRRFWLILVIISLLTITYVFIFDYYTSVDYKNLNFETFDNGHEWEERDY